MRTELGGTGACPGCGTSYRYVAEVTGQLEVSGWMRAFRLSLQKNAQLAMALAPCPHCNRRMPGALMRAMRCFATSALSVVAASAVPYALTFGFTVALGLRCPVSIMRVLEEMVLVVCALQVVRVCVVVAVAGRNLHDRIQYSDVVVPPASQLVGPFRSVEE